MSFNIPIVSYYVCIADFLIWIQVEQKNGIANIVCVFVLHHMFPSVNHFMQKMSNANGSFSVQATWDTNMAFLAELNEETPKGWCKGEGLS